jgi:hypothetical protein
MALNGLPNYRTSIEVDGFEEIDLHCESSPNTLHISLTVSKVVHQISSVKGAIPLLFSHGCKISCPYPILQIPTHSLKGRVHLSK